MTSEKILQESLDLGNNAQQTKPYVDGQTPANLLFPSDLVTIYEESSKSYCLVHPEAYDGTQNKGRWAIRDGENFAIGNLFTIEDRLYVCNCEQKPMSRISEDCVLGRVIGMLYGWAVDGNGPHNAGEGVRG